ncbi:Similar to Late secretory pathway protein AVL9; acc. no. Q12500 [Pyronema omphalodes CBS 100304]|uniref:Similar to Late secretory pathway protein AVL9 acc. no. Q12500 n=1 Tax=Pyronema omphalodes (strain CBS 100304) TaxID=1076935 RepID=U4LIF2_PYROM|nr:Similar to Late secretory pathway protein AVL9; acc. no. Q12500 [Pyronema omphalodes CBS 100304]
MGNDKESSYPVVSIINFNHARGPEVEQWIGVENEDDISDWPLLPFLALTDGAHTFSEDFSYFTLKHRTGPAEEPEEVTEAAPLASTDAATAGDAAAAATPASPTASTASGDASPKSKTSSGRTSTLFGISCTRQLDSRELIDRPADVTRSTVQKAVVVIADTPTVFFGHLKEQLSAVTQAWFAQRNFEDLDIIRRFQESLKISLRVTANDDRERDHYVGLPLRELVYEYKHQALVLFKCMLLQPKMLFFGTRGEKLCMTQFSLISLIPGLLRNLRDCSDPELDHYESTLVRPTSVKTSDRNSLLSFMGLPLQIFGKGALFGPYTPLQQLDILADVGTKSYIVGSTNSLLLQQRDRYSDVLINLEEKTVNVMSPSLRTALNLSAADRRWIDSLVLSVTESWDDADPSRPKTMGFVGSEEYIRLQFEEYILSMISAVKYHLYLERNAAAGNTGNYALPEIEGDPSIDFNPEFVEYWKKTENFRIFQKFTDPEIPFDLVHPKHIMAGGLTVEDVQRRIAQQVSELGLDEKLSTGKAAVANTWTAGRTNLSLAFVNLNRNIEQYREQRRIQSETDSTKSPAPSIAPQSPTGSEIPAKTGYISSWAAWAGEKRKKIAGTSTPPSEVTSPDEKPSARSSIFSRWSKGSWDSKKDQESEATTPTREGSQEIVRETVWDSEVKRRSQEIKTPTFDVRKSLPPPPLPEKNDMTALCIPGPITEESDGLKITSPISPNKDLPLTPVEKAAAEGLDSWPLPADNQDDDHYDEMEETDYEDDASVLDGVKLLKREEEEEERRREEEEEKRRRELNKRISRINLDEDDGDEALPIASGFMRPKSLARALEAQAAAALAKALAESEAPVRMSMMVSDPVEQKFEAPHMEGTLEEEEDDEQVETPRTETKVQFKDFPEVKKAESIKEPKVEAKAEVLPTKAESIAESVQTESIAESFQEESSVESQIDDFVKEIESAKEVESTKAKEQPVLAVAPVPDDAALPALSSPSSTMTADSERPSTPKKVRPSSIFMADNPTCPKDTPMPSTPPRRFRTGSTASTTSKVGESPAPPSPAGSTASRRSRKIGEGLASRMAMFENK